MMVEHHPVQTSAVFLCGAAQRPLIPPPSPPSPLTPTATEPTTPIEELCLDGDRTAPAISDEHSQACQRLAGAVHVLNTEATALRKLAHLYETDSVVGANFSSAIAAIAQHRGETGKLIIIGVGKSGHIGRKLVASFNSLGIPSMFLHPTEALHGDLGMIGANDTLLFITFSGKTSELLLLLPHINPTLPTIIITSHTRPETCELIRQRPGMILLPAPIHEPETVSFGVPAPTTSTTMALAIGDALAIVASQELSASVSSVFSRNHPGGAIGASFRKPQRLKDIAVPICDIPVSFTQSHDVCGTDILRAGYDSSTGWVRTADLIISPSQIRRLGNKDLTRLLGEINELGARREELITVRADSRISEAVQWIRDMQSSPDDARDKRSILAVVENEDFIGVLDSWELLKWTEESSR